MPQTPPPGTTSTSQFQPFSFSVTSGPMRQLVNSNAPFRLPSILDRFRRPSTSSTTRAPNFFLTLGTTPSTIPSIAVPFTAAPSPATASPPVVVAQPAIQTVVQPVIQNPSAALQQPQFSFDQFLPPQPTPAPIAPQTQAPFINPFAQFLPPQSTPAPIVPQQQPQFVNPFAQFLPPLRYNNHSTAAFVERNFDFRNQSSGFG